MERKHQDELTHTFAHLGADASKKSDLGNWLAAKRAAKQTFEPGGRPDFTVVFHRLGRGGIAPSCFIECKGAIASEPFNFPLSELAPKQRIFLTDHIEAAWVWLFMGLRANARELPRTAFLVPWREWLTAEAALAGAGLASLTYGTPQKLVHRNAGLSAVELLGNYQLQWVGKEDRWEIPRTHTFWTRLETHIHNAVSLDYQPVYA